ncbi:MAG: type II toxin-antitoxin system RelE/ParE family toxin [Anaerolineaceae bacterium]|nr:type II toxin-antitoxin system RelE/ParE family toxin [Anaerolineaceae bacterium]
MKYVVEFSKIAIRDLDRVRNEVYAASRSDETAGKYVDDLLDRIEEKDDFPQSSPPLYYGNRFTGYYFIVFKAYIAFYRLEKDVIFVERVLYRKSNYLKYLHISNM